MGLAEDLNAEVQKIFRAKWETRSGTIVPSPEVVGLGNDAIELDATVLYADLAQSTALVDKQTPTFAAEVYKTYLHCAAKVIRSEGGEITAYDGDRIMAVYLGSDKNSAAARTALKINHAVQKIINPAIKAQYPDKTYDVQQCVGVDTSTLLVARTGVRGANDLVWVGRSANYAAKLCGLREGSFSSWITADVFNKIESAVKVTNGTQMWEARQWNGRSIYRSNWMWKP